MKRFTFTIQPELLESLKAQAKKDGVSVGYLLNLFIAAYLQERQGLKTEIEIRHGGDRKSKKRFDLRAIAQHMA